MIEILAMKLNAALADLREYGRCNVCKHYDKEKNECNSGKLCYNAKSAWEWRGVQK